MRAMSCEADTMKQVSRAIRPARMVANHRDDARDRSHSLPASMNRFTVRKADSAAWGTLLVSDDANPAAATAIGAFRP